MTKAELKHLMDKYLRIIKEMHSLNHNREELREQADAVIRKIKGSKGG